MEKLGKVMVSQRTKRWLSLLAAGAVGVGTVFGGGLLARIYDWMATE